MTIVLLLHANVTRYFLILVSKGNLTPLLSYFLVKKYLLSPGQTIATCQRNISQHCWAQHVACVWPPCCEVLGAVGSNLTIFKLEPTTPYMSQHIATRWPNARNMLCPTMLGYVALACCDRLAGAYEPSISFS